MADRVAVMLDGRIAQEGPPRTLYERPANRAVAAFVGTHSINLVPGPPPGGLPGCFSALPEPAGGPVVLGIRPEHLRPDPAGRMPASVSARLLRTEYQGQEILLDVVHDDGTALRAIADAGAALPEPGGAISLGFSPRDLHLFDAGERSPSERALGGRRPGGDRRMRLSRSVRDAATTAWLVGPATTAMIVLVFAPVAIVALLAFTDYQFGARSLRFVGLDHFRAPRGGSAGAAGGDEHAPLRGDRDPGVDRPRSARRAGAPRPLGPGSAPGRRVARGLLPAGRGDSGRDGRGLADAAASLHRPREPDPRPRRHQRPRLALRSRPRPVDARGDRDLADGRLQHGASSSPASRRSRRTSTTRPLSTARADPGTASGR